MVIWLQAFIPKLLGRAHVTAYVTGNIGVGAAADLARRVQSLLSDQLKTRPPFPSQVPNVGRLYAGLFVAVDPRNSGLTTAVSQASAGDPQAYRWFVFTYEMMLMPGVVSCAGT